MPVSGLVVVLSEDPQLRANAIGTLEQQSMVTMGVLQANRLAIVLETDSKAEDQQMWNWLHALSGVVMVEVAFVGFEEPHLAPPRAVSQTFENEAKPTNST
jgi:hypothetical protein